MNEKVNPQERIDALLAEVSQLKAALSDAATAAEESARRAAFFNKTSTEVPTGRTTKILKAKNPYARTGDIEYVEVDQPTYFYTIDMPPVGGTQIRLDGIDYYHGQTYEFSLDQLRTVKEIVHRVCNHEAEIHGTDENAYRPKSNARFSGKTGTRVH